MNTGRILIGLCALLVAGGAAADHRRVIVLDDEDEVVRYRAPRHHRHYEPVYVVREPVVIREIVREPVVIRERVIERVAEPRYGRPDAPRRASMAETLRSAFAGSEHTLAPAAHHRVARAYSRLNALGL